MLSQGQALDVPMGSDTADQDKLRALGLTIGQFVKTVRGRSLIMSESRFVLGGKIWQGYNEHPIECTEDMMTQAEIDAAEDIDGTKQTILDTRFRRQRGAANNKDRELAERKKIKIAQERDELELLRLRREEAKYQASLDPDEPEPEVEPEPTDPDPGDTIFACKACGKSFKNARGLNAHKMGSKH